MRGWQRLRLPDLLRMPAPGRRFALRERAAGLGEWVEPVDVLVGLGGFVGFWLCLHLPGWLGAPPVNLAVWTGSLVTDSVGWARLWGTLAELAATVAFIGLWRRLRLPLDGRWLAATVWLTMGLLLMPLYGWLSPWIRDGLSLAPGPFLLGMGPLDAFALALAALAFGMGAARTGQWLTGW